VDKWRTNEFFRGLGLTAAASWLPGELDPAAADYPLFVKPRFGSASGDSFKANTPEQLTFFSRYVPSAIVQEHLAGPEITNDVVCDLDGNLMAVVSRERIRVRGGEVVIGKTVFDPAIAEACVRIAKALPAIGPITVQCMRNNGATVFTEINGRLGGGAPCGVAAGADWPRWLLARLAGIPVEIPPLGSYQTGLYFSRFHESLFTSEADCDEMVRSRL
jgi:carbamoyl-phosphate synthase large subunit